MSLKKASSKQIETLYWRKGYSSRQIAPIYGVSYRAILNYMKKHNISRRPPGGTLHTIKHPFSGDRIEKAYLLGFRATDLYATWNWKQVQVSLTGLKGTLDAFRQAFSKYAPVKLWTGNKCDSDGTRGYIYAYLDSSFQFLINKPDAVPKWIVDDDEIYAFFAGCVDGDGSIKANPRFRAYYVSVYNSNLGFLHSLMERLYELGYTPGLFRKDSNVKMAAVYRYNDLKRLIPRILCYMGHTERIKKAQTIHEILENKIRRR